MSKIAIVTGGSRGIGAAICERLAKDGVDICVNYANDAAAAEAVADKCRALGVRALPVKADIASSAEVETLFGTVDETLGPSTILVNNAGIIGRASRLADLDDATLQDVFATNLFGATYCMRAAIARMSTRSGGTGGAIVNISSIAATLGSPGEYVHYAASKAALDAMTIGLSKEIGPEGIRVNSIQTGTTDTDIHRRTGNPDRPAMVAATAPLRRVAQPIDIAEAVAWLASDAASYTTGAILRVGGGL